VKRDTEGGERLKLRRGRLTKRGGGVLERGRRLIKKK